MENIMRSTHYPKFILMPGILSVIYMFGTLGFVLLWSGIQYIPGFAGFEQYGLIYSFLCLLGAICNFAILWGHRWGVFGQVAVWAVNSALNIFLQRNNEPYFGLALLFVGFWIFNVYRNRQLIS